MKVDQKSRVSRTLRDRLKGVGQLLRTARVQQALTQDEAANVCGVCRQTISRIEQGDPSVAWGQVGRMAEALGVQNILGGEAPANPDIAGRRVRTRRSVTPSSTA